jgi:hypothetical protein
MGNDRAVSYYDKLLGGIAASLLIGSLIGLLGQWDFFVGMFVGAVAGTAFVYHGLFWNPPTPEQSTTARTAAVVWHAFVAVLFLAIVL